MVISQGDVFWVNLGQLAGSEPGYSHPNVIIQNNMFNHSRLNTVLVCGLALKLLTGPRESPRSPGFCTGGTFTQVVDDLSKTPSPPTLLTTASVAS